MSKVVKVDSYTSSGKSCVGAKRIYARNLSITWHCPDCKEEHEEQFNRVPLISYGDYCHSFYCDDCGYESVDKMYELNSISSDSVNLTFSENNKLQAFEELTQLKPL